MIVTETGVPVRIWPRGRETSNLLPGFYADRGLGPSHPDVIVHDRAPRRQLARERALSPKSCVGLRRPPGSSVFRPSPLRAWRSPPPTGRSRRPSAPRPLGYEPMTPRATTRHKVRQGKTGGYGPCSWLRFSQLLPSPPVDRPGSVNNQRRRATLREVNLPTHDEPADPISTCATISGARCPTDASQSP